MTEDDIFLIFSDATIRVMAPSGGKMQYNQEMLHYAINYEKEVCLV